MSLFSSKDSIKETWIFSPNSSSLTRRATQIIAVSALALALALAPTQSQAEIQEDALFEISLGSGLSFASGDLSDFNDTLGAKSGFNIHASGGYFITELMSVGLAVNFNQFSLENDLENRHYRFYSFGTYLKYHFGYEAKSTPYVRVDAGLAIPNLATRLDGAGQGLRELEYDPSFTFGLAVGSRFSTSEWGGLYLELAYRMVKSSDKSASFQGIDYVSPDDAPMIQLTAGFSFDIGPKS